MPTINQLTPQATVAQKARKKVPALQQSAAEAGRMHARSTPHAQKAESALRKVAEKCA